MKVIIIALALALLSVLPAAAAVAVPSCPTDITVGSGQYVKLSTTPVDPGIYYYYWYSTGITLNSPTSTPTVDFKAPLVTGTNCVDYIVSVDVTNKERGSCADTKCITVHVCPTPCPLKDDLQCVSSYVPEVYEYTGHWDNTLVLTWTVNAITRSADAGSNGKKLTIPLTWLKTPTSPTGTDSKACTNVTFKIADANQNILTDCNAQICLVYKPIASISGGTTPTQNPT